jgi:hypothetical protein
MTYPHDASRDGAGPTGAQLRAAIDAGRTGERVAGCDPAAAPLITDDEAAGATCLPQEVALDLAQTCAAGCDTARANAATPELTPDGRLPPQRGLLFAAVCGVAAGVALGAILFAAL